VVSNYFTSTGSVCNLYWIGFMVVLSNDIQRQKKDTGFFSIVLTVLLYSDFSKSYNPNTIRVDAVIEHKAGLV